jgi:hypothetical protein
MPRAAIGSSTFVVQVAAASRHWPGGGRCLYTLHSDFPRRRPACSEAVFETYLAAIQIAAPGRLNLLRAVPTVSYSVTSRAVAGNPMRRVLPIMSAAASAGSAYRLDHNMMILRVNTLNNVTAVGGIERPAAARHIMALELLVGCSDRGA